MTSPLVSVITVTYNRPKMLLEAIESVRAQIGTDWEHLVTDDGSTGVMATRALLSLARDPRVSLTWGQHLDRPAVHWNRMVGEARGKYVTILDDDNLKHPKFIEVMAGYLDAHPDVDVVTCGFVERSEDGAEVENHSNLETAKRIDFANTVDTNCWLARREALRFIGPWPEGIRTNEDWWFMRRVRERATVEHLPEVLVTLRAHPAQRSHRREELGNEADKLKILTEEV